MICMLLPTSLLRELLVEDFSSKWIFHSGPILWSAKSFDHATTPQDADEVRSRINATVIQIKTAAQLDGNENANGKLF
ncbi:hypothetical protein Trydic_g4556 [Trypoxylus dichotomus]